MTKTMAAIMDDQEAGRAVRRYRDMRRAIWSPPERLKVWEWAERSVVLSERTTPFPGPFRVSVTPYNRGPMEAYTDRHVKLIVLVYCTQSGKTECMILVTTAYDIAQDPGPEVIVLPNADMARSFSETRLQPMLDNCAEVACRKPSDPDRYKLLEMHFDRMTLNLLGSNSPANLAQRPVRNVKADEIDKYPAASVREADALSLVLERYAAFWNRKGVLTSTPTFVDGNIWRFWRRSDQRHYLVPCPHCGHYQKLIMGTDEEYEFFADVCQRPSGDKDAQYRLRWPKDCAISDLDDAAWYECEKCGRKIYDKDKRHMLDGGRWSPAAESAGGGIAGFHLNALYVPWIKFGEVAAAFLRSKRYVDELQNFYNSKLALPWDAVAHGSDVIKLESILQQQVGTAGYQINECPADVIFLTCGIDVQAHEIWYVVRGWGYGESSWLVSFGRVAVETDQLPAFVDAARGIVTHAYARPLILAAIDSGWGMRTAEVYTIARLIPRMVCVHNRRSNVTRVTTGKDVPIPRPTRVDKTPDGRPLAQGPLLYSPSTTYWKRWLFARVNSPAGNWHWPRGLETSQDGQVYLRHMGSEREVTRKNKTTGKTETLWIVRRAKDEESESAYIEGHMANHLLDCEVQACIAAEIALTAGGQKRMTMEQVAELLRRNNGGIPVPVEPASVAGDDGASPTPPPVASKRRAPRAHDL